MGRIGDDDRRLWRAVAGGCDVVPTPDEGVVERYAADGWSYVALPGKQAWSATHGVPFGRVAAMAERLRWVCIIKLLPYYWMFRVAWFFFVLLFPDALTDYDTWIRGHAGHRKHRLHAIQSDGCVGVGAPAMLGAAVARHYACGTSTFRGSFPKGALMNIRRHGGDVLTGKRVVALIRGDAGRVVGARCSDGCEYRADAVVSAIGVVGTRKLARLPELAGIGAGTGHFQLFMGFHDRGRVLPRHVVWHVAEDGTGIFLSFHHQRHGRVAVNVVTPVPPDWSDGDDYEGRKATMVERLQGMFRQLFPSAPWPPAVTAAGTRHRHHLPRAAPFLRAGRRRSSLPRPRRRLGAAADDERPGPLPHGTGHRSAGHHLGDVVGAHDRAAGRGHLAVVDAPGQGCPPHAAITHPRYVSHRTRRQWAACMQCRTPSLPPAATTAEKRSTKTIIDSLRRNLPHMTTSRI